MGFALLPPCPLPTPPARQPANPSTVTPRRLRHRMYWSHRRTEDLLPGPQGETSEHVALQRMAHHAGLAYLDEVRVVWGGDGVGSGVGNGRQVVWGGVGSCSVFKTVCRQLEAEVTCTAWQCSEPALRLPAAVSAALQPATCPAVLLVLCGPCVPSTPRATAALPWVQTSHLCLHPRFGPWFSLRCVIIFDDLPYAAVRGWKAHAKRAASQPGCSLLWQR